MKPSRPWTAALLAALTLLSGCLEKEPIRIGFIGELTGNSADLGEAGRNGTMLAIDQINQTGGINGRRVELLARDTGSTAESAIKADGELLGAKVVAVIGPMTSTMTEALLPLHDAEHVLLISPTATAVTLAARDDHLLRINRSSRYDAQLYAKYCLERGFRRVGAAVNLNNRSFSASWIQDFKDAFEQAGGQIITSQDFDSDAESLLPVVQKLLAPRPDALLFVANAGDSARLAQQTRKLNSSLPLLATDWAATEQLIELGGNAVEGMAIAQQFDADDRSPGYTDFRIRYFKRFGRNPVFGSVFAHDATTILLDVLSRHSGTPDIKKAILESGPFQGVQEMIQFDAYGDTHREVNMSVIRGGRYVRTP